MRIAVLSGKGGTGKTFVSVNLACVADEAVYVDCDVEEPNGHLFLKPEITKKESIGVFVPEVDMSKCTACRKCVDFCQYNALALLKDNLLIFNEVCHSCGGCILFCPEHALTKKEREIGYIEAGKSKKVSTLSGCLHMGEVSGVPIIKKLIDKMPPNDAITVVDCPPGSACVVMESIREADYCVLVAEPTLFGAHNLAMVYELTQLFRKPIGVVLNKCLKGDNPSQAFCKENQIKVLTKIPYDEELAKLNSEGFVAVRASEKYHEIFFELLKQIEQEGLQ